MCVFIVNRKYKDVCKRSVVVGKATLRKILIAAAVLCSNVHLQILRTINYSGIGENGAFNSQMKDLFCVCVLLLLIHFADILY